MFEHLLSLFRAAPAAPPPLPPADARHALGALLVRVAVADRAYLFEEIELLDRILARRFDLNPLQAMKLRAECERLEAALPETGVLAGVLSRATTPAEREATVLALWRVALADGHRDGREVATIARVAALLEVAPETVAQLQAEAERDHPPRPDL